MNIAYYITAHGFGHGARSCDIIRAIRSSAPGADVFVVTELAEDFLRSRLDGDAGIPARRNGTPGTDARPTFFRRAAFDSGMFQLDSIRVDLARSLAAAAEIQSRRNGLIAREREFLRSEKITVVCADIPAIPLEAARLENIPAIAIGNFGWDWIYEDFIAGEPRWKQIVESFRDAYSQADLLLRFPFAEPMAAFPRRVEIPLVASPGKNRRDEIAKAFGISAQKKWVLLSFASLDWNAAALDRVSRLADFEFFTVMPLAWPERKNLHAVDRGAFSFSDVVASADIVVSKPGHGILSECCVNDRPLVYAERTYFREYPVLETAIRRHLRGVHIPSEKLYAGDLEEFLHAALRAPPAREPVSAGGAEIVAREIIARG